MTDVSPVLVGGIAGGVAGLGILILILAMVIILLTICKKKRGSKDTTAMTGEAITLFVRCS